MDVKSLIRRTGTMSGNAADEGYLLHQDTEILTALLARNGKMFRALLGDLVGREFGYNGHRRTIRHVIAFERCNASWRTAFRMVS